METQYKVINCPSCGGKIQIDPSRNDLYCLYCGAHITQNRSNRYEYVHREVDEAKILKQKRKLERERAEREDAKKAPKEIAIVLLVFVLLVGFPYAMYRISVGSKATPPVNSSGQFENQMRDYVYNQLKDAGFKNIELIGLEDLARETDGRNGKVSKVTIAGETGWQTGLFGSGTKEFSNGDKVRIYYHSVRK